MVLDVCGFFYAFEFVEGLHCVGCRGVSALSLCRGIDSDVVMVSRCFAPGLLMADRGVVV